MIFNDSNDKDPHPNDVLEVLPNTKVSTQLLNERERTFVIHQPGISGGIGDHLASAVGETIGQLKRFYPNSKLCLWSAMSDVCLLYTSDAADELTRRHIAGWRAID